MQAAGHREARLATAEPLGKRGQQRRRDLQSTFHPRGLDRNRLECSLSADPARRGGVEAPLQPFRVETRRLELDGVRGQIRGKACSDRLQPFGQREAERQLLVVARRTHGHRNRTARDADLERLLDRDDVHRLTCRDPDDIDPARGIRHRPHAQNVPAVVDPDEAAGTVHRLGT